MFPSCPRLLGHVVLRIGRICGSRGVRWSALSIGKKKQKGDIEASNFQAWGKKSPYIIHDIRFLGHILRAGDTRASQRFETESVSSCLQG
jgi:hypothetical protein